MMMFTVQMDCVIEGSGSRVLDLTEYFKLIL